MPIFNSSEIKEILPNDVIFLEDAQTFYIRANGRDTNSGQSSSRAWKTLAHAYKYIRQNVITNGHQVTLDIDSGEYLIDELLTTVLLSSPVNLHDNYVVVPKQEQTTKEELEKSIRELYSLLHDNVTHLKQRLDEIPNDLATNETVADGDTQIIQNRVEAERKLNEAIGKNTTDIQNVTTRQSAITFDINDLGDALATLESKLNTHKEKVNIIASTSQILNNEQNRHTESIKLNTKQLERDKQLLFEIQERLGILFDAYKKLEPTVSATFTTTGTLVDNVTELKEKTAQVEQLRKWEKEHGTVTLLYAAADREHNNAVALAKLLPAL